MSLKDDAKVQFAFGLQCLANDDMVSARSSFARVTQLDPQNLRAWLNYGAACGELAEEANEVLTALEAARPGLSGLASMRRLLAGSLR